MLFDIEQDRGDYIVGYLVTDSYVAGSSIRITSGTRELARISADEVRQSVVAAGRHATGQCGFVLTEQNVPGLSQIDSLEIRDAESNFVIYRRRPDTQRAAVKLFRLETRRAGFELLDNAVESCFQLVFPLADRFGRETCTQALLLKASSSLYVSARLLYKEFEYSIDERFQKLTIIQDPYIELAETLLALQREATMQPHNLDLRTELSQVDCRKYVSTIDMLDPRDIRRSLARMPTSVEVILANPVAKLLAARTIDEAQNKTYLPSSLTTLSTFDIVGIREIPESYIAPLVELLPALREALAIEETSSAATNLARILRKIPLVATLIETDIELYDQVRWAYDVSYANGFRC